METLSVKVPQELKEAVRQIGEHYNVSMSQAARMMIKTGIEDNADILQEHTKKDWIHADIRDKNKWKRRRMEFRENVYQEMLGREGKINYAHPPHPAEVWDSIVVARWEEAEKEYPQMADYLIEHLVKVWRQYVTQWHDRQAETVTIGKAKDPDIETQLYDKLQEELGKDKPNMDRVRSLIGDAKSRGAIPMDKTVSDIIIDGGHL